MALSTINFTQISNEFIDFYLKRLSPCAVKIFLVISRKTIGWHKETEKITNSELMILSGVKDKKTILRAISELESFGLIKKDRGGEGRSTITTYDLNFTNGGKIPLLEENNGGKIPPLTPFNRGKIPPLNSAINIYNKESIKEIPPLPPHRVEGREFDNKEFIGISNEEIIKKEKTEKEDLETFNLFWEAYPRKQGDKKGSFKKWKNKKARKIIDFILEDIQYKKTHKKPNGWLNKEGKLDVQYIEYPSTYINQERWNDEEI